jgi:antitoxin component of MazEF toxin-antitoxin module
MYGKSLAAKSGDKSGVRSLVEKITCASRQVKVCGMIFRPCPGLRHRGIPFPTACAVGYCLSPFGLETECAAKLTILTCLTAPPQKRQQRNSAMTVVQLPDDQAAALKARAAAQGLTLEAWFEKLSGVPESTSQLSPRRYRYSLAELMAQCDASAPLSAEDRAWIDAPAVGREA